MVEEKSESLPGGKKRYETYEGAVSLSLNEIESTEEEPCVLALENWTEYWEKEALYHPPLF